MAALEARTDWTVHTATTASAGHACLDVEAVDCIVSGYVLPEVDGVEFLEAVRSEWPDLPFIFFTASEHLDPIARTHDRMDELIDSLLSLAQHGRTVGETTLLDLETVVEEWWATVQTDDCRLEVDGTCRIEVTCVVPVE